ncbi:hypothetical protein AVEN_93487-1 [Araneus ventricosus]|uniref:Uncharacterized protein n=1 Tax=Araneus ventricosus TaxID=182803 RepID=A0A4Y2APN8_ARAVE|nr:hypothetical protein AVEN_93487-1 [Araneus ventricosus]
MVGAKVISLFSLLPWMWGLFQVVAFGNLWYIIYLIPYLLVIEKGRKKTTEKGINVSMDDFTVLERKDAFISTDDTDCLNNTNNEMIELKNDCCQDIFSNTNPFLAMLENLDTQGDALSRNPFIIEDACQLHPYGNPFMDINDIASVLNTGEGSPALRATNPFSQDCSNNQIVDISIFFPNRFGDVFTDIPCASGDSDIYCKEWIEQHRKYFIKTVRSFSIY